MPVPVACPGCSVKLNAPDTAAGKKVKCPKCQAVISVPAAAAPAAQFEVVDEPAPVPAKPTAKVTPEEAEQPQPKKAVKAEPDEEPRSKRKEQREDEEDEERPRKKKQAEDDGDRPRKKKPAEDEEDNRPRKKKGNADEDEDERPRNRKGKGTEKKGAPVGLLIGAGLAGLMLLGGVGFAAYWFGFRSKGKGDGPAPVSVKLDDWEEYASASNAFKASFPGKPEGGDWKPPTGDLKVTSDIRRHRTGEPAADKPSLSFFAGYVRFPDNVRPGEIAEAKKWLITSYAAPALSSGGKTSTKVNAGGREWDQDSMTAGKSKGIVRWHQTGPMLHLVGYRAENQTAPEDAVEKFFAAHQILGGDPGDPDPDPIKLDGWQSYTSPDDVFKVSFPGESKKMSNYFFEGAKSSEFREYTLKDDKGKSRTYFAGYARFASKPGYKQVKDVTEFLARQGLTGDTGMSGSSRVTVGGWPWGKQVKLDADTDGAKRGVNGIVRWVEADSTIFAIGMKAPRFPSEKELEQFFGSFEILDVKPDEKDLAMPGDWREARGNAGEYRAMMPPSISRQEDPFKTGPKQAGVSIVSLTEYKAYDPDGTVFMFVVKFAPNTPEADRQKIVDSLGAPAPRGAKSEVRSVTWAGIPATEAGGVRRTHNATFGFVAGGGMKNPELVKAFLDSVAFDPPDWAPYRPTSGGFRAILPWAKGGLSTRDLKLSDAQQKVLASVQRHGLTHGASTYVVYAVKFVPGTSEGDRESAMRILTASFALSAKAKLESRNKITWSGRDAFEQTFSPADVCQLREMYSGDVGYVAVVYVQNGKLEADKAKLFLDSFTFDKE